MYKSLVFGCIALLFAWPLAGTLLLGVDTNVVLFTEMVALTAFLLAVDGFWWWVLVFRELAGGGERPSGALIEFKFWQSLTVLGVLGGFWVFGPLTGGDSRYAWVWPLLVLGPVAILFVRMMMGFAGWKR